MSTWELKENSTGLLSVTVDGEKWADAQKKAFNKIAGKLSIPGFRAGKVPAAMAKKYISEQEVLMEAVDHVASAALMEGVEEHKLWMIDRPSLDITSIDNDAVVLAFTIAVKPEVTLGEYTHLGIKKDGVRVTKKEIEEQLKSLQNRFAELEVKEDGAVENGDTAVIDFEGFKDGIAFDGGKGENYPLEIGSGTFIPGFEEQLIGMKAEGTKDIGVTFPENYQEATLAGRPVTFKVTVHEIKSKVLPEINDELIAMAHIENVNTVAEFEAFVKEDMKKFKERQADEKYTNDVLDKLVENTPVDVPNVMVEHETDGLVEDFKNRIAQQGLSYEQFCTLTGQDDAAIRAQMRVDAESKVKVRLVLEAIADKENFEVSEDEINAEYQRIADAYHMDVAKVKELVNADNVVYDLRLRKAIDLAKA